MTTASRTAIGLLSFGLVVPFAPGLNQAAVSAAETLAAPAKHVIFVHDGRTESVATRAATVGDLLTEAGIARAPEDLLDADPAAPLSDGATVTYRAAVPVSLTVDGFPARTVRSAVPTVGALLAAEGIAIDRHDRLVPGAGTALGADLPVRVVHVRSWLERRREAVVPPVRRVWDVGLLPGKSRVVAPGAPGEREVITRYERVATGLPPHRTTLAARLLHAPRTRVIAQGVATYASLADLARRGIDGTIRLASSALSMVATAYTAGCAGCSGITASGRAAGHGIVAVDPRVIPLGTHLFIPGYGHAVAGDTGGAIIGNRIDLGFNSNADAMSFGRRPVTVYVLR